MENQQNFREQLLNYLTGRHAHASFDDALNGFPIKLINTKPANSPYTFWELLEHIRRTQNDIVDFIQNPNYKDKSWPQDYWPAKNKKADKKAWDKSVAGFKKDFAALVKIVKNPKTDLLAKIPHGQGQTIFREAILVIDHNAYHIGEFILMRRMMGIWKS
jgi:hypothetical protein